MRHLSVLVLATPLFYGLAAAQNGITVGRPKAYDNRTLTIMLEQLNTQLRQVQVIDPKALAAALGTTQGYQSEDVSQSLSVSASPTPQAPAAGGSTSPTLPTLPTPPAFNPQFGENAADLLSDQVNLSYQIFNLRMLLERSITERLLNGRTRRQAVVGFNISLDPPKEARDAAAYVQITLQTADGSAPISLVAAMPQEKTYNSAALSTHASAFGGSAAFKILSAGYSRQRRQQTFFLFRDTDTMALENMSSGPQPQNSATFGWVFRPVLGRRSVSPGMRQMFAVIALPDTDDPAEKGVDRLKVTVTTTWKRYDRKTLTTYGHFTRGALTDVSADLGYLEVPATFEMQQELKPRVDKVQWMPTDQRTGVLLVEGKNFFTGTTVKLGPKVYATDRDGLTLKSDQTMILNTTERDAAGEGVVNARYGPAVPLVSDSLPNGALTIQGLAVRPRGMEYSDVLFRLARVGGDLLHKSEVESLNPPIVLFNGEPVGVTPSLLEDPKSGLKIFLTVQNAAIRQRDGVFRVLFPFAGPRWSAETFIYDDSEVEVTRLGGGDCVTLLITGHQAFLDAWKVILDKAYETTDHPPACPAATPVVALDKPVACPDCYVLRMVVSSSLLNSYKKFELISNDGVAQTLDIPPTAPPPVHPSIDGPTKDAVYENEVRTVVFTGKGLGAIKKVTFDGKPLPFICGSDGRKIEVVVSRDVTAKPGHVELILEADPPTILPAPLTVLPAPHSPDSKGAQK